MTFKYFNLSIIWKSLVFKKVFKRKGKTREIIFWVDRKADKKMRIATSYY